MGDDPMYKLMALTALATMAWEFAAPRIREVVLFRNLPREWDYNGHTLTIARDGSVLAGSIDGVRMAYFMAADVPLRYAMKADSQLQKHLEWFVPIWEETKQYVHST